MVGEWVPPQEWMGHPSAIGFDHQGTWRGKMGGLVRKSKVGLLFIYDFREVTHGDSDSIC